MTGEWSHLPYSVLHTHINMNHLRSCWHHQFCLRTWWRDLAVCISDLGHIVTQPMCQNWRSLSEQHYFFDHCQKYLTKTQIISSGMGSKLLLEIYLCMNLLPLSSFPCKILIWVVGRARSSTQACLLGFRTYFFPWESFHWQLPWKHS